MDRKQESLDFHEFPTPGKIEVLPKKPCKNQKDLSLAYTPGVANPCLEIQKNPDDSYRYTSRGNLVAVVSNGTAVLGLGNIGAIASKPVMEGKGVLFKRFADVDVFDIEVNEPDPHKLIDIVASLEPTFGGINLEDIKGPDCFIVENALKERMRIPVFHDDQHGTAIISGAALLNSLKLTGKKIEDIRVVFSGAGAAGISCAHFYLKLGVKKENLLMCDTCGIIFKGRIIGMNEYKEFFASDTKMRSLSEAMKGADVFVGVSSKDILTDEMVLSMDSNPVVFALANPDPEMPYDRGVSVRKDIIMATGRSDFPNQVNNVLGFPFIFRGALDIRAREINDEMKLAASFALAELAGKEVPDMVKEAYGKKDLAFGKEYIIPKPFDPRVFIEVSSAVAEAAIRSGVALKPYTSKDDYRKSLQERYENSISRFVR